MEKEFDENKIGSNEVVIGPFYTTSGDTKATVISCAEFYKKDNDWKPRLVGAIIEYDDIYCLPVGVKNPTYTYKRIFVGKEDGLNKYNLIVRFKKGGYFAVGSMSELWHFSGNEHKKDPFLVFVRIYKGGITSQERFEPMKSETEEQYKKRLWAETNNIIDRLSKIK